MVFVLLRIFVHVLQAGRETHAMILSVIYASMETMHPQMFATAIVDILEIRVTHQFVWVDVVLEEPALHPATVLVVVAGLEVIVRIPYAPLDVTMVSAAIQILAVA